MPITLGQVHALFDNFVRKARPTADPAYSFFEKDGVWRLVGPTASPGDNAVLYARLDPTEPERAIDRVIEDFRDLGHGFEWKVYGYDRPPGLGVMLTERGLEQAEPETLMVFDPRDFMPGGSRPTMPCQRVSSESAIETIGDVHDGEDGEILVRALVSEHRADPDALSVWIVQASGRTVAAAWTRFPSGGRVAGFWGGTVLPEWRGNRIYSALVAARVEEARRRGVELVYVEAEETSRPILLRWGFTEMTRIRGYIVQPPLPY